MNFAIEQLKIEYLLLVHSKRFDDLRGHFMGTSLRDAFRHLGIDVNFAQAKLGQGASVSSGRST